MMFNEEDTDEDIGSDQLPPGLSHQVDQLILGAAQHFDAENPNLDITSLSWFWRGWKTLG